jgi:hypothetical protein
MIQVITGDPKFKFHCQGKIANSETPIGVKVNHDIQVKLNEGTLKIYEKPVPPKPVAPKPAPKVEPPKVEPPKLAPKPEVKEDKK